MTGLGTLTNKIGLPNSVNPIVTQVKNYSYIRLNNELKGNTMSSLIQVNQKPLHYKSYGDTSKPPIIFVHGLGGSSEYYTPLIQKLDLENSHSLHSFDLEGHGLSPTSPLSKLTIKSMAEDLNGIFDVGSISTQATVIAHSMGCLVALHFALEHPERVSKLVLIGPPRSPLPESASSATSARADTVRTQGMTSIVDSVVTTGTSDKTRSSNPVAVTAIRISLLGQNPEGYAKACNALASAKTVDISEIQAQTLIITGSEDKVSPPDLCERYVEMLEDKASLCVLKEVGHWHVFEDVEGVAKAVKSFL